MEVAAADDETAFAVPALLAARWGIAPADRTTQEPGALRGARWRGKRQVSSDGDPAGAGNRRTSAVLRGLHPRSSCSCPTSRKGDVAVRGRVR
ncbi:DUF6207 family protein [Streptomyces sp. NPDC058676]|uniref:DUF6207 family protein n=1 Tax=unclassified Streptomyces TaxID=2593676 RepID=UPI003653A81F